MLDNLYIVDILNKTEKRAEKETFFSDAYTVLSSRLVSFEGLYICKGGDLTPDLLEWVVDLDIYALNIRKRPTEEILEGLRLGKDV